ncbi:RHS repeat domain-containing protein, partial [Tenacibaculum finnmarkense]|uniref:RHS repeat domain-containing protein n=1 Tax=Tenacibaculum finnmarkense TaxID=2781243 RepID=UPI00293E106A
FSISEDNAELITSNTYDDLGQLISKKVGNKEASPLQTVDYKYNVQGWLKDINDDDVADNDLFKFSLKYNDPTSGTALFNGNISQTSWNTLSTNTTGNSVSNQYTYSYDALNRITGAIDNTSNYNLNNVSYDKNGNIKTLIRKGHINIDADDFDTMDNLVYSYDSGNKLLEVTDTGLALIGVKGQFQDKNTSGNDYTYDVNGNMTKDLNKGITKITYNHLNLPKQVTFNNSNQIEYSYDATGVKQIKTVKENNGSNTKSTQTAYAGNFIYHKLNNGGLLGPGATAPVFKLEFFNHPEGYVSPLDANDLSKGFKYIYQYKDHLGNVRLSYTDYDNNGVINASSEIVEESNYYPFGLKHKGYNNVTNSLGNSTAQKFGFGGKELSQELGIEWMDFGARNYDAALGRWMNLDPLAEQMRRYSPYNYAFDNPVYFIDPDGMKPNDRWKSGKDGTLTWVNNDGGDTTDYVDNVDSSGNVTSTDTYSVETEVTGISYTSETDSPAGAAPGKRFITQGRGRGIKSMSIFDMVGEVGGAIAGAIGETIGLSEADLMVVGIIVNPKKALKQLTRKQAISKAKNFAKVPRLSKGGEKINMNDLNPSSRGRNWEKMKADGATNVGNRNPNGRNQWMEHPDKHPDAGEPNVPAHHSQGHVHATNKKGATKVFPYK